MEDITLNPHYVIWYKNVATLLVTLLIPLSLLAFWNWNTYDILRRRRRLRGRPILNQSTSTQDVVNCSFLCHGIRSTSDQGIVRKQILCSKCNKKTK